MAKKDQMICTEKQRDVLEKLFAEILVGGNFRESNCCLENMCLCKALVILCLLLNASLMNPDWLRPAILHLVLSQRHPRTHF